MRKIVVLSFMSLDGVMQAPGGREEDPSGGFKYGGWASSYMDNVSGRVMRKQLRPAEYLLGRKTFKIWEAYWPRHARVWPAINERTKYVMSRTVKRTPWQPTVFLKSLADIRKLKQSRGSDLQVHGSGELVQLLLRHDLVDEIWLKIYPLTLGRGKKLFGHGTIPAAFKLTWSIVTPKGVIMANYRRGGKVKTGTIGA